MVAGEKRVLTVIMGAAGRDFHDFNMLYRDNPDAQVVAFTAAQIPGIGGRRYPPELAGPLYPDGIPIIDEAGLVQLVEERAVERVVFAYSDLSHAEVMHRASAAISAGADFVLPGARRTMIAATVPVVAVCAVRTGCGKSQLARHLSRHLRRRGMRVAVLRHPMPYGALARQAVQRLATLGDLRAADCTVEEREEYEPHIAIGNVVFAGVDYQRIVAAASAEADVIIWDGGNNDLPFVRPDVLFTLVDPLRPGDETAYHPGEAVLRMADAVVVAKSNSATEAQIDQTVAGARSVNPAALVIRGASEVALDDPAAVHGKRVLVVEDGPTLTHGGMPWGAGHVAVTTVQAAVLVDPRDSAAPGIAQVFEAYPHIGPVLPAVGYNPEQLDALRRTIADAAADVVVVATPCDLSQLIEIPQRVVRARYEYADLGEPTVTQVLDRLLAPAAG